MIRLTILAGMLTIAVHLYQVASVTTSAYTARIDAQIASAQ